MGDSEQVINRAVFRLPRWGALMPERINPHESLQSSRNIGPDADAKMQPSEKFCSTIAPVLSAATTSPGFHRFRHQRGYI